MSSVQSRRKKSRARRSAWPAIWPRPALRRRHRRFQDLANRPDAVDALQQHHLIVVERHRRALAAHHRRGAGRAVGRCGRGAAGDHGHVIEKAVPGKIDRIARGIAIRAAGEEAVMPGIDHADQLHRRPHRGRIERADRLLQRRARTEMPLGVIGAVGVPALEPQVAVGEQRQTVREPCRVRSRAFRNRSISPASKVRSRSLTRRKCAAGCAAGRAAQRAAHQRQRACVLAQPECYEQLTATCRCRRGRSAHTASRRSPRRAPGSPRSTRRPPRGSVR